MNNTRGSDTDYHPYWNYFFKNSADYKIILLVNEYFKYPNLMKNKPVFLKYYII